MGRITCRNLRGRKPHDHWCQVDALLVLLERLNLSGRSFTLERGGIETGPGNGLHRLNTCRDRSTHMDTKVMDIADLISDYGGAAI
jgi:hypothetical protein